MQKKKGLVIGKECSFNEAFPEIEEIEIRTEESDSNVKKYFSKSKSILPGEFIECSNPICHNGKFYIRQIIREMVINKEMHREGRNRCYGQEYMGSSGEKGEYRPCLNILRYKIDIKYKAKT